MAKKITVCGLLIALAFVFSYLESLVPIPLGIPGVKLGLANLVVLTTLYWLLAGEVLLISLSRIALASWLFGSLTGALFSLCGGLVSFAVMTLMRRSDRFSPLGVSVAGGVSHNLAQLLVAWLLIRTPGWAAYAPFLLFSGILAGALIGVLGGLLIRRLRPFQKPVDESDKT
ncbi:MAG: Gx transporter family protein [Clostridia bacterium]|nr:Gx transporter family protein [Clostridia bacterium]